MKRNTYRIPLGFLAAAVFLLRADPTAVSYFSGACLMVFGEAIRFISSGTLVKFEGVTRDGIYAYTRNPLYLGSFFIGLGACIMGRDPIFTVFFLIVYPLVYYRIIRREEQYLVKRYGHEYELYLDEVSRVIPRRIDLRAVLTDTAPFLAMKNREYLTVLGIAAVWAVLAVIMVFFR